MYLPMTCSDLPSVYLREGERGVGGEGEGEGESSATGVQWQPLTLVQCQLQCNLARETYPVSQNTEMREYLVFPSIRMNA